LLRTSRATLSPTWAARDVSNVSPVESVWWTPVPGSSCQRREIDLIELLDHMLDFVRDQLDFVIEA
jgi:hypothetical protein